MNLECLKGKLIVSCQALPEEPLHSDYIMGRMAIAAKEGGASGIRAQSVEQINEIMRVCDLPLIGIIKRDYPDSEVYITATRKEVEELLTTKCQIIALDATMRKRPNDEKCEDLLQLIHQNGRLAIARLMKSAKKRRKRALTLFQRHFAAIHHTLRRWMDRTLNCSSSAWIHWMFLSLQRVRSIRRKISRRSMNIVAYTAQSLAAQSHVRSKSQDVLQMYWHKDL